MQSAINIKREARPVLNTFAPRDVLSSVQTRLQCRLYVPKKRHAAVLPEANKIWEARMIENAYFV